MKVFDGHLDLAMNALDLERDLTRSVAALRQREAACDDGRGLATMSFPALTAGGVRWCVSTVLARAKPWIDPARKPTRHDSDWPDRTMAHAVAAGQLAWYRLMERRGALRLIESSSDLDDAGEKSGGLGVILTMEGADPITEPAELAWWYERGLRTLMFAHFGQSSYAHGTPSADPANTHDVDGPLTDLGRSLLKEMAKLDMPLDLSHLSDQSFAESAARFDGPIYASHSSCRSLVPGGGRMPAMRMLTDNQIKTIVARCGVIGLPLFNAFLKQGYAMDSPKSAVTLACDLVAHVRHVCDLAGDAGHVAIGSDLDGGFGAEHIPAELDTAADLPKLADVLADHGFDDNDTDRILRRNWLDFYRRVLPA